MYRCWSPCVRGVDGGGGGGSEVVNEFPVITHKCRTRPPLGGMSLERVGCSGEIQVNPRT